MIDEEEFETARKLGEHLDKVEPRAVHAEYDAARGVVMVQLRSGCWFGFPPQQESYLKDATQEQLAAVEVIAHGEGLQWEELDAHTSVPGVIFHALNAVAWCPRWIENSVDCPECRRQVSGP